MTGGSRGIGAGAVKAFLHRDYNVVATSRIMTPPVSMPLDAMQEYAEVGVNRLVVNLGSQRPERVDARMAEIERLVKQMH